MRRALAAALLAAALCGCATFDRGDLRSDTEQIHSAAGEGALLAQQAARHTLPVTFVWLHSAELHHEVGKVRTALAGQYESPARIAGARLVLELAARVQDALAALHQFPDDGAAALAVRRELDGLAQRTERLGNALQ